MHAGKMEEAGPKACAATPGTTILVEDLFFNVPLRRKVCEHFFVCVGQVKG
jgi:DNA mismatch repair ATPase MutL